MVALNYEFKPSQASIMTMTVNYRLTKNYIHHPTVYINEHKRYYWTLKGVRATVVTAGHCTHAELTVGSGHASASCYSCCVHSHGLC